MPCILQTYIQTDDTLGKAKDHKQDNKGLEQSMEYLTRKKDTHLVTKGPAIVWIYMH